MPVASMPSLLRRTVRGALLAITVGSVPAAGQATARPNASPTPVRLARAPFGRLPDGRVPELFTLTNAHGVEVRITNYGAIVTVVRTPDRTGRLDDIALGYDSLAG